MSLHVRAALLLGAALMLSAAPIGALTPAPTTAAARTAVRPPYCAPIAFRDRVITPTWYEAVVRVEPGCTRPARVRKENAFTGSVIGPPSVIPVGAVERVWVFTHRLVYTLDGRTWRRLVIQ